MFRHCSLAFLVFLLNGLLLLAQNGNSHAITGKVVDEEGEAVPYAAVAVFTSKDSALVKGTTSDDQGVFSVEVAPGTYRLQISFLSLEEKTIPDLTVRNADIRLGNITMRSSSLALEEVTVTAEKQQMELKLDKRVFNIDKDLNNTGNNASEILENLPSVNVDVEGNVSLRGSQNVRILIDGKPSGLVGMSSTDALRQLQGNMIEKVEIITNPSARYDAEGEVGIINIVLKKEKQKGVNGTFDLTTGYPANHGGAYNLNYRRNNINLFSSLGITYRQNPGRGNSYQEFYEGDSTTILRTEREHSRGGVSGNFQLGSDFFLDKYNSVAVSGLFQKADNNNESSLRYKYENVNGERLESIERDEEEHETKEVIEGNVTYRKTFQQKDREWNTTAKYVLSEDFETAELQEVSDIQEKKPVFQRTDNAENEITWLFQSDYVHPFGKDGRFETGAKSTLRNIENDFLLEQRASDGNYQPVSAFDNHFLYQENIHAAYGILGNKKGKFSYQFGLRWEYSDITTELTESNEKHKYEYHNLFPSSHFSYELKKQNSVQLSYSRRISRPRFRHLLPFYGYSDSRNLYSGNPELQPEFSNSIEAGHLKYWEKGSLLSSVYYRYRTGVVERISISDSVGTTRRFPVNLSTQHAFGIEFNVSYNPYKWWRLTGSVNFYRAITDGSYEGRELHSDAYTVFNRVNSKFALNKKTDFQLSFDYKAPEQTPQGKDLSMYSLNTGFSREVLKGKGTLSFTVNDIFNTRKRRSITDVPDFYSESEFQWRTRQLRVNFNYRLNQQKKKNTRKMDEGDMDDGM